MRAFIAVVTSGVLLMACQNSPKTPDVSATKVEASGEGGNVLRQGFANPETVLYDPDQDVYFVSNINGSSTAKDKNGFVSRISAADQKVDLRWLNGETGKVTLDAPKGMAISGDTLWVADIDILRAFDRKSGAEKTPVSIRGSVFLNGLAAAPDGTLYVSDSGMEGRTEGPGASFIDAIYRVSPDGKVDRLASGQDLKRPDGLVVDGDRLWMVTFGSNELVRFDNGVKAASYKLPNKALDGIVRLQDGTFLISSWDANGVYHGPPEGPFDQVVSNIASPAGIGFDTKRNLLLIPSLESSTVTIQPFQTTHSK